MLLVTSNIVARVHMRTVTTRTIWLCGYGAEGGSLAREWAPPLPPHHHHRYFAAVSFRVVVILRYESHAKQILSHAAPNKAAYNLLFVSMRVQSHSGDRLKPRSKKKGCNPPPPPPSPCRPQGHDDRDAPLFFFTSEGFLTSRTALDENKTATPDENIPRRRVGGTQQRFIEKIGLFSTILG